MSYFDRVTKSARGEVFNPLIWPFLLSTLAYGIGALVTTNGAGSSLVSAMLSLHPLTHFVWGTIAILTIICGITFLLFDIPPFGKVSGIVGFMLWVFGAWCYIFSSSWLPLIAVALPNMWFWFWQYLSLSKFRRQDAKDKATMEAYDAGEYDDNNGGKKLRETNRGKDLQSSGSYDNPDDGGDSSRPVDDD